MKKMSRKKGRPQIKLNVSANKNLPSTRVLREVGIKDLENYIKKIQANVRVFEEAIKKEKVEMKRTKGIIKALKNDIKTIDQIQRWQKANN